MLSHCTVFKANDIWLLSDLKDFKNRKLFIGYCPQCKIKVVRLEETRIIDNRVFIQTKIKRKAERLIKNCKKTVIQTRKSIPKGKLCGFVYGLNTEIHNNKGQVIKIRQVV